ncbi:MAG: TetR/AcrR family transcriptional regulator [Desulfobacterales bacterium]|nr:TetR/AcrR family transcriptional regulator [Desulfobacterales bacterium]
MGTPKDSEVTRAKLIQAAGSLFAERGFRGVTVRDIVQEADTHLSALNYHFRNKAALYREALLEACKTASISGEDQGRLLRLDPRKALLIIVKESIKEYSRLGAANWQIVLITRESWEPSEVFEEVAREYFKPETDFIARIVGKIVDQPPDSHHVRFAVISLLGLLETFGLYGHLTDAAAPGLSDHLKKKDWLAKKITRLVLEAANPSGKK